MNYENTCKLLGMNPDIHFVEINEKAEISFTSGKPNEIRLLLRRVREAGLTPAQSLIDTVERIDPSNAYLYTVEP